MTYPTTAPDGATDPRRIDTLDEIANNEPLPDFGDVAVERMTARSCATATVARCIRHEVGDD